MLDESKLASLRSHVRGVCYRMTGSVADADDLAQETLLRLVEKPPPREDDLRPWVTRVAVNLARDAYRRRRHAAYTGSWLPEPCPDEDDAISFAFEPASTHARYDLMESASIAFLVALEALSARQRAVLILRDVLDYSVEETAQALGTSAGAVKVTHHRARHAMRDYDAAHARENAPSAAPRVREVMGRFFTAVAAGDTAALETMLAADVTLATDAAGEFTANLRELSGADRVVRFLFGVLRFHPAMKSSTLMLNGRPAIVWSSAESKGRVPPRGTFHFDVGDDGRIRAIHGVVATAKLAAVPLSP
ncbi:MAG: sigma-70 family RNA polymerase sigma factor [Labilithrix sp.]|nr:sigma-70 family RNA polymerase sigma factor [Labilithrix sp.]MCW5811905.1 sigma-70 family RNA polymerase sigma factor [Labilithrix sp.]